MAGIGLALQAMWAANVLDIQKTLHQVGVGFLSVWSLLHSACRQQCRLTRQHHLDWSCAPVWYLQSLSTQATSMCC